MKNNPDPNGDFHLPAVEPWPEPVDGNLLLFEIMQLLRLFIVLPKFAAETLALWVLHTYAFHLRNVSTYIGIESPLKQCGKTTLLTLLSQLVCRPEIAATRVDEILQAHAKTERREQDELGILRFARREVA